jgi:DNA repair protein RadA/Sms
MARRRDVFVCESCGGESPKWQGQCPACGAWNTLARVSVGRPARSREPLAPAAEVAILGDVAHDDETRVTTGIVEFDRVLGGGFVRGSVTLIGGDPGIGKSTLLLQAAQAVSREVAALYATGEESLSQVSLRSRRLGIDASTLRILADTCIESVLASTSETGARLLVVDSIQTMYSEAGESAPGSASQVRDVAAAVVRHAKTLGTAVVLIGHVTKEGQIAGPRIVEHMVDTVLYFESDAGSRYRLIRAVKNRFGAANEIGVFAMSEHGLKEVRNPSAIFLSRHVSPVAGSIVMIAREGSRPLLIEVQALVDETQGVNPRRVTVGLEQNRLALLLAVLHRHAGVSTAGYDVFVNVVGGVHIAETAADLPAVLAAVSSLRSQPLPADLVSFGELGLAGEIRPVPFGEERLREAAKHGFRRAIVPSANVPRRAVDGLDVIGIDRVEEALLRAF